MMKSCFGRLFIQILSLVFIWIALTACKEKVEIVEQIRALKTITVSEPATGQIRKFSGLSGQPILPI